mmetsp:Transcript_19840/g.47653  ORF Transcript_19840/g.47653 Transcript_19840/m.47653 type:complete len:103 (-) Transcript_19840:692-1000(-)
MPIILQARGPCADERKGPPLEQILSSKIDHNFGSRCHTKLTIGVSERGDPSASTERIAGFKLAKFVNRLDSSAPSFPFASADGDHSTTKRKLSSRRFVFRKK